MIGLTKVHRDFLKRLRLIHLRSTVSLTIISYYLVFMLWPTVEQIYKNLTVMMENDHNHKAYLQLPGKVTLDPALHIIKTE